MNALKEIQAVLPSLTKTQAKVATYILENPDSVCFLSLKKLAEEVGVTETTVLSFCKKTDFQSFVGIKKAISGYMQDRMSWNKKLETSSEQYAADEGMLNNLMENQRKLVDSTLENIDTGELFRFVDALSSVDHIYICGHEASLTIATNLHDKLRDSGARVNLIDVSNYSEVLNALTHFTKKDIFILITLPFYSAQTVAISDYLASAGGDLLAITDKMTSPIVKNASHVLLCNSDNMVFHNSIASLMAVSDIIASMYILQNKDAFRACNDKVKLVEDFFKHATVPAYEHEYLYNEEKTSEELL